MNEMKLIKHTKTVAGNYEKTVLGYASLDECFDIIKYLEEGEGKGFSMSLADFIKRMHEGPSKDAVFISLNVERDVRFIYNEHLVQLLLFISMSANGPNEDRTSFINAMYGCFPLVPPEYSKYAVEPFEQKPFNLYGVNAINCVNIDRYYLEK